MFSISFILKFENKILRDFKFLVEFFFVLSCCHLWFFCTIYIFEKGEKTWNSFKSKNDFRLSCKNLLKPNFA